MKRSAWPLRAKDTLEGTTGRFLCRLAAARRKGKALGLTALALLALIPAVALAAPVMIDFEDLETGGVGTAGVATVRGQYASKGIVFNDPTVLDYSKEIPGFAHSGAKAIEPCYSEEFCTTPIRMTFTTPQSRVKLWLGYRVALSKPPASG